MLRKKIKSKSEEIGTVTQSAEPIMGCKAVSNGPVKHLSGNWKQKMCYFAVIEFILFRKYDCCCICLCQISVFSGIC